MKKEINLKHYFSLKKGLGILIFLLFILFTLVVLLNNNFNLKNKSKLSKEIKRCSSCNIVIISIDALRQSNMSLYGYSRETTPNLDKFLEESFIFTNAVSASTWTLPSHMSWFTGVYPSKHKILNKYTLLESGEQEISNLKKLSPGLKTLAEVLKSEGYLTGGFTGGSGVNRQFGYSQGFDIYYDEKDFAGFEDSIPRALAWVKQNKEQKLFVFLHGYDVHGQYIPAEGYDNRFVKSYKGNLTGSKDEQKQLTEEGIAKGQIYLDKDDIEYLTSLYDEKVQRADQQLATFIKEYSDLGLLNKTIFIIASDHGEELYEHGRIDHGHSLYEELIRVPLVVKLPEEKGKTKIDQQIRSIDIMPTILDLANIKSEVNKQFDGLSLLPAMKGEELKLDAFIETDYRYASFLRALRKSDNWKIIQNFETSEKEIFNLKNDLNEKNNLVSSELNKSKILTEELSDYLKSLGSKMPKFLEVN